ncbi:MAG: hypothetical protein IJ042_05510 [Butyricicoccus sp.]|nr:hypothetical protein [Butyricicoccus sp.]
MIDRMDFAFFMDKLKKGERIDESSFYFADDDTAFESMLGCLPAFADAPYWVGGCDIPDGTEFPTAEALVNAPIFGGRSLRERWEQVRFVNLYGIAVDDWLKMEDYEGYLQRKHLEE